VSCRGHRQRALIVRRRFANETWRWQRSGHRLTSGTLAAADASGQRRADETHVNGWHGPLDRWKGQTRLAGAWSVGSMGRSKPSGARHDPLDRWKGQTGRSLGFVLWSGALTRSGSREFKGRPRDSKTMGSVQFKPSFPRSIDKSLNRRLWCSPGHSPKHPTCWVRRRLARIPGLVGPWPVKIS
jgi:hypothetical protein